MRLRNDLLFTFGLVETEQIVFENKPPTVFSHVHRVTLAGNREAGTELAQETCSPDEYLIWTHLETYSQFWFCLQWWRLFRDSFVMWLYTFQSLDKNYKIFSLCSLCPTGLGQIYSADSEWSLIWIFLFGFQQIFSHDMKIFRIIHKCIIASFNGLWGL